jgi:hypothetical protein
MLQRRKQGQRRLGALVEVGAARREAVEAAARVRVPHDVASVVVSEEPGLRGAETVDPTPVAAASTGQRKKLGQLL